MEENSKEKKFSKNFPSSSHKICKYKFLNKGILLIGDNFGKISGNLYDFDNSLKKKNEK